MGINSILVATDFSENAQAAFEKACDLALQLGAKLHVLHVQDESALRVAIREGLLYESQTDDELGKAVDAFVAERLKVLLASVDQSKLAVDSISRRGEAGKVISEYARETGAGIIVVGRRGAGMIRELVSAVVGSVAESVIRKSPCPVLIVRRDH